MFKSIIWDLDDTLIYTNALFEEAKQAFCTYMRSLQLFDNEIYQVINDLDIAHVKAHQGYHKECFPYALRDTYQFYCQKYHKEVIPMEMQRAEKIGWQVFQKQSQLIPGAREVLSLLRPSYQLFLLTKGEDEIQNRSLDLHGLRPFFKKVYIFPDKTEKEYHQVIAENQILTTASWSIGNSIKADINPSLLCGLNCIHFNTSSWDYEYEMPLKPVYSINSLSDCLEIILGKRGGIL